MPVQTEEDEQDDPFGYDSDGAEDHFAESDSESSSDEEFHSHMPAHHRTRPAAHHQMDSSDSEEEDPGKFPLSDSV